MDGIQAIEGFSALAQGTRLAVFRLLVTQGPEGMAAGDIARHINVPQNTLSSHLSILSRGGLVYSRRAGRVIYYSANMDGVRELVLYLTQDCCQGHPQKCGALIDEIFSDCEEKVSV